MRTVLLGDIIALARALLAMEPHCRHDQLDAMIRQTDAAHQFHKRFSRPHHKWGNGSLMSRANFEPQVKEPFASDLKYLHMLQLVIAAIVVRKTNPDAPSVSPRVRS